MLIPAVSVAWLGWSVVQTPRRAATSADQVAEIVTTSEALQRVAFRLSVEGLVSVGIAEAGQIGVDVAVVSAAMGVDVERRFAALRSATDAALTGAAERFSSEPSPVDLEAVRVEVVAQRQRLDDQGATPDEVRAFFDATIVELTVAARQSEITLIDALRDVGDGHDLEDDLHVQGDVTALRDAALAELEVLLDAGATTASRDQMVAAFAVFDIALEHLRDDFGTDRTLAAFVDGQRLADYLDVRQLLLRASDEIGFELRATAFAAALDSLDALAEVSDAVAAHLVVEAGEQRVVAHDELRATLMTIVAVSVLGLAAAIALARSVTRPLRRLHGHAVDLSAGNTSLAPLPVAGPRELATVTETINEVVATLERFGAQAAALASRDLADPVFDAALPGALGSSLLRSMEQISALTERLEWQATRDPLTGLLNRATVPSLVSEARAGAPGGMIAVLSLDLDGFKELNDRHGHAAGDDALRVLARRFERAAGGAAVARHGGDEFVIVIPNCSPHQLELIAQRLIVAAGEPLRITAGSVSLSASIGAAMVRGDDAGVDVSELLRRSDLALYHAKATGRARLQVYDADLRLGLDRQRAIATALEQSIPLGQFTLRLQPIVDARSGRPWGAEALLRWKHPELGDVAPDTFIPVAERSGQILRIDSWVILTACEELVRWEADPCLADLVISVNVSGRHLGEGDLVRVVTDALATTGARASQLRLELTETYLLGELDEIADAFAALRSLGVTLALDDFGTGYGALTHLRQLPFDSLKVDRSFIAGLGSSTEDSSIVSTLVRLGQMLRLDVVAEGVETDAQRDVLTRLGCHRIQGFGVAHPLPMHEARAWLIGHRIAQEVAVS